MERSSGPAILDAECHALFAFDVGREIHVEEAARVLGAPPPRPVGDGRPPYVQLVRPPVRCSLPLRPFEAAGSRARPEADCVLYEFGAVAVLVRLPVAGTLADLAALGAALVASDAGQRAAREVVEDLVRRLGSAVEAPTVAPVVEEYLVFHAARSLSDVPVSDWAAAFAPELAGVLRADPGPLSAQEVAQTVAASVSYAPGDLVLVDWNAAFVARPQADDVLAVLTFANVQLLELRLLDTRLDDSLHRSYETVQREESRLAFLSRGLRGALGQVARRQIDAALLFEHVRNAPKLLGDQYLARVYEHAARRFRLADWDDSLHTKLDVLGTIYERLRDRAAIARAEVLEWIVILLILVSILLPFLVPYGG